MRCLIVHTETLPGKTRKYRFDRPLIAVEIEIAEREGRYDWTGTRMLDSSIDRCSEFTNELMRAHDVPTVKTVQMSGPVVIITAYRENDWENIEKEFFAALKRNFDFDEVQRLN